MSNMNLSNFHEIACLEGRHGTCMLGCTVNAPLRGAAEEGKGGKEIEEKEERKE